jgi:hypothetical protein
MVPLAIKPDRSGYSALDFSSWKASGQLAISPRFQRRQVWTPAAKSYLIDTVILGFPVPPIYIRIVKGKGKSPPVREVIDGQQRITAITEYVENEFPLSKSIESPYKGLKFDELPQDIKDRVSGYSFICEVFQGISDEDVLSIFSRLNTYSVRLNRQELRNGRYFGPFKQTAYELAYGHLTFWRNNRIFTETNIARMIEVEFTSELIIALLDGLQDKKKSIDKFYKKFDEEFPPRKGVEKKFRRVIDEINEVFPEGLAKSEFRRTPLFYSLFLAIAHRLFGIPGEDLPATPIRVLSVPERKKLHEEVRRLSAIVAAARKGQEVGGHNTAFVNASLSQTDNLRPRRQRLRTIYSRAFE